MATEVKSFEPIAFRAAPYTRKTPGFTQASTHTRCARTHTINPFLAPSLCLSLCHTLPRSVSYDATCLRHQWIYQRACPQKTQRMRGRARPVQLGVTASSGGTTPRYKFLNSGPAHTERRSHKRRPGFCGCIHKRDAHGYVVGRRPRVCGGARRRRVFSFSRAHGLHKREGDSRAAAGNDRGRPSMIAQSTFR